MMKAAVPIRRLKHGRVQLDVLALRRAIEAGTLSASDRKTAEAILPGVTLPVEQMVAGLRGIARNAKLNSANASDTKPESAPEATK